MRSMIIWLAVFSLFSTSSSATTYYLKADGTGDFPTIEAAVLAATNGDVIVVADGTYNLAYAVNFVSKAVTLMSENGPQNCILDAAFGQSVVICVNLEGPDTVVDGFTLAGGDAYNGGGIQIVGTSPTFVNNIIRDNYAQNLGGGIYISGSGAYPTIINNIIEANQADEGGGVYNYGGHPTLQNNTIVYNEAPVASGYRNDLSASITMNDNILYGNWPGTQVAGAINGSFTDNLIQGWVGPGNFAGNPAFATGPLGNRYLGMGSDALDAGGTAAGSRCFTSLRWGNCMDRLTATTDQAYDVGVLDVGFHYLHASETFTVPGDFGTIQAAINAALTGDVINVGPGTYPENISFLGKNVVVQSTAGPDVTIIDGTDSGAVATFAGGETRDAVLRGFTLTGGLNSPSGGGVYCSGSEPILTEIVFLANQASDAGGGFYCIDGEPLIDHCTFIDNVSYAGGAVFASGTSAIVIEYGVFVNNWGALSAGDVGADGHTSVTMDHCSSYGAMAGSYGGSGLALFNTSKVDMDNGIIAFGAGGPAVALYGSAIADIACTDIFGNAGGDWTGGIAGYLGVDGNFSADPLYCDGPGGVLNIDGSSPCAPYNNPGCGLVGALLDPCPVRVIDVNAEGTGDYATIQAALAAANGGDTIQLAPGTFTGVGNRDLDFMGKAVTLRGSPGDPPSYVLDCQGSAGTPRRGIHFQNGEGSGTVVEGLLIRNGYAAASGGGIRCAGASPTLNALVIEDCEAGDDGGGIALHDYASPAINWTLVQRCVTVDDGGGLYAHNFSSPVMAYITFYNNEAGDRGGGALFVVNSFPTVANANFIGNTAANGAGACFVYAYGPVTDSVFFDNIATVAGGGLQCYGNAQCTLTRVTLTRNTAPAGAGIWCRNNSSPAMANTLIADNLGSAGVGRYADDCNPTFACCNLHGNAGGDWVGFMAGMLGADGNTSAYPVFCNPDEADFQLAEISPCNDVNSTCGQVGALGIGCQLSPVGDTVPPPTSARLTGCFPNPFNPATTVRYELPADMIVDLKVYDLSGRLVAVLVDHAFEPAGRRTAVWDGRDQRGRTVAAGVYLCRLTAGGLAASMPMALVK